MYEENSVSNNYSNKSGNCGISLANTPIKSPQMFNEIDFLRIKVENLKNVIARLETRLSVVLHQEQPCPTKDGNIKDNNKVPLSKMIEEQSEQLGFLYLQVESILERLEI